MNALMFSWMVNVFYLSLERNVLLLRVLWLMSVRYFKRISALHLLLQSCSCFSKNRSSKTDSGVPSQLLQFITAVVRNADINGNLHISQFPFTCVATNTVTFSTPWEQESPSTAGLPVWMIEKLWAVGLGCLYISSRVVGATQNNRPPENVEGVSSAGRVLVIFKIHWNSSLNICCSHSLCILALLILKVSSSYKPLA